MKLGNLLGLLALVCGASAWADDGGQAPPFGYETVEAEAGFTLTNGQSYVLPMRGYVKSLKIYAKGNSGTRPPGIASIEVVANDEVKGTFSVGSGTAISAGVPVESFVNGDQNSNLEFRYKGSERIQIEIAQNEATVAKWAFFAKWDDYEHASSLISPWVSGLSAGDHRSCVLRNKEGVCWELGKGSRPRVEVTRWKDPQGIYVWGRTTCVLDGDGAYCWGKGADEILKGMPPLRRPRVMSVGGPARCVLGDGGIQCWGENTFGQLDVPPLSQPTAIAMGVEFACAIDGGALKCWGGRNLDGELNVPKLNHPRMVSASGYSACAIDDDGLHCWGAMTTKFPAVKNPRSVSVGDITCALGSDGLTCWYPDGRAFESPQWAGGLTDPRLVSVTYEADNLDPSYCVVDEQFVHCGSANHADEFYVPDDLFSSFDGTYLDFNLDQVFLFLPACHRVLDLARAAFLEPLIPFVTGNLSIQERSREATLARYLLVQLISPAIESSDSDFSQRVLIPAFGRSKAKFAAEIGLQGPQGVPSGALTNRVALTTMQASVSVMTQFAGQGDLEPLRNLLRALGQATADPLDKQKLRSVLQAFAEARPTMQKLETNPKSAFLGKTAQGVADWLKGRL